jgi:methylated-DNA-[protein]-cysteine S-methyltransferase
MCAALWTRNLGRGLPATTATEPLTAPEAATAWGAVRPRAGAGTRAWSATADSAFGLVCLAASAAGVCAVALGESRERFAERLARRGWQLAEGGDESDPEAAAAAGHLAAATRQLAEYFAGARRDFALALDLSGTTAFDRRVLAVMASIPYGETRSYGELARAIGSPGAARAVGHACGRNPLPLLLPCHRVVRGNGALAGFGAGGVTVKAALLALEQGGGAC